MIALNRRYYKYGNNPVVFTVETSRIKVVIQYIGNLCHRSEKSNDSIATPVSLSFFGFIRYHHCSPFLTRPLICNLFSFICSFFVYIPLFAKEK